jgi:hypothetical protein
MRELTDLSPKKENSFELAQNSSRKALQKSSSQKNLPPFIEPINLLVEDIKEKPLDSSRKQATDRTDYAQYKDREQLQVGYNKYSFEEYNKQKDSSFVDRQPFQLPYPDNHSKAPKQWLDASIPTVDANPVRIFRESNHVQSTYAQQPNPGEPFIRQTRDTAASPGPSYLRTSSHQQLPVLSRREERVRCC